MAQKSHRRKSTKKLNPESPNTARGNGRGMHESTASSRKSNGRAGKRGSHHGEFRIIVIGASAGGVEALSRVICTLPPDFPAAIFVVLHISPAGPSLLPEILTRVGRNPAVHARNEQKIAPGFIYIAPPDHHLLIKPGRMVVTRGPRENNARPAIDPLFRTAARSYGPWVVGIILSGGMDDGTLGLMDVKRFDGVALVQDPEEAMFPSMPNSAIENVQIDRVLSLDDMGPLLTRLAREPVPAEQGAAFMARNNEADEPDIAEEGSDELKTRNLTGPPSKFTCPECGGALWEILNGKLLRYRCHVGHGFTAESLMAAQGERLEDALWSALRALDETAGMRRRMAERARKGGWNLIARSYEEQAQHAEARAGLVRSVLVVDKPEEITRQSARSLANKASRARDYDTGKAGARGPRAPVPAGAAKPPNPSYGNALESEMTESSVKSRRSTRRSARKDAARRGKSD